jgi:hypothetical protein
MNTPISSATASPGTGIPLKRDDSLYRLTQDASDGIWDLFRVSREFDSTTGNLTEELIGRLNDWARASRNFSDMGLKLDEHAGPLPREILLLDGSPNRLPLSAETARIISAHLEGQGLSIPIHVINRRDALMARVTRAPRETLVLSQTAQRSLYDARLSEVLVSMGAIVVPGPLTAPGGPLSNKERTYDFLGGEGHENGIEHTEKTEPRRLTARYRAISVDGRVAVATADAILDTAAQLREKWGNTTFFVKPQQGGGGIGCFRIDVHPKGYSLPDLSRLGIVSERLNPMPLSLDPGNRDHVRALAWLAGRYSESPATTRAYLHNGDLMQGKIANLMKISRPILEENLRSSIEPKAQARERLAHAIENYQQLFGQAYHPLICDWIDFGLYSVRVHIRLGRGGPVLESLYARLFPVEFTHQTIGTVGVDSIANHEGEGMEFNRYVPLIPQLVELAGGADALCDKIKNSFFAFQRFLAFLPPQERERMPVRAGFDISPLSGLIPEGNADPVRGHCANTRWSSMFFNTSEWAEDALAYFSWKSQAE